MTWKCHVCGVERPDAAISVASRTEMINGRVPMEINVRYCNDNPSCIDAAATYSFFTDHPAMTTTPDQPRKRWRPRR